MAPVLLPTLFPQVKTRKKTHAGSFEHPKTFFVDQLPVISVQNLG